MNRAWLVFGIVGLALLLGARAAHADGAASAREHFDRGTTLYDLHRFDEAAAEYERAFELHHDPALLFNIGQAYRAAGVPSKAVQFYRSYLRRSPRSPNRAEVQARIEELQRLIEDEKAAREHPPKEMVTTLEPAVVPAPPPAPIVAPAPVRPPGRNQKIAGLTVAALGVASLAVAGAFQGLAAANRRELEQPVAGYRFSAATEDAMNLDQRVAIGLFAAGGAAIASGVIVGVLGLREPRAAERRVSFVPAVGPGRVAATVDIRF